jgi:hypothetical protein
MRSSIRSGLTRRVFAIKLKIVKPTSTHAMGQSNVPAGMNRSTATTAAFTSPPIIPLILFFHASA